MVILTIVFFALIVLSVFLWGMEVDDWGMAVTTVAAIVGLVFLVCGGSWLTAQGKYGTLIGTKKSLAIMEESIRATADAYYAGAGETGIGVDLPNMKQSTNLTEAIVKYTTTVVSYNQDVEYYRSMRRSYFGRATCPKVPDELTIIGAVDFKRKSTQR
jgi:hypothetical protein